MINARERFSGASALEKGVYLVLVLVLALDVAVILFARADDDVPETRTQQRAAGTSAAQPSLPSCANIADPGPDDEPVTCRTSNATLTVADEARPMLLGGTQVRFLSASLAQGTLAIRLRVRNETDEEQGILEGGQRIYVNVDGIRTEPSPPDDIRLAPAEAATVSLDFPLSTARAKRLRGVDGEAELGVVPWPGSGTEPNSRGLIHFTTEMARR